MVREINTTKMRTSWKVLKRYLNTDRKWEKSPSLKSLLGNILRNIPNWSDPGPDGLQGLLQLQKDAVAKDPGKADVPSWMMKGRIVLILKNNCLFLFWKMLTGITVDEMYRSSYQRCSVKKMFLEISQNWQENNLAKAYFLIKLSGTGVYLWILQNL